MDQKAKGRACTVIVTSEEREEKGEQPGDRESWLGARGKGWLCPCPEEVMQADGGKQHLGFLQGDDMNKESEGSSLPQWPAPCTQQLTARWPGPQQRCTFSETGSFCMVYIDSHVPLCNWRPEVHVYLLSSPFLWSVSLILELTNSARWVG